MHCGGIPQTGRPFRCCGGGEEWEISQTYIYSVKYLCCGRTTTVTLLLTRNLRRWETGSDLPYFYTRTSLLFIPASQVDIFGCRRFGIHYDTTTRMRYSLKHPCVWCMAIWRNSGAVLHKVILWERIENKMGEGTLHSFSLLLLLLLVFLL